MKELEYPVFMKDKDSSLVVCFSSINAGHVVVQNPETTISINKVGTYRDNWIKATDTEEQEPYTPPLFEDGAIIWCWDTETYSPTLRRYDAINKCSCSTDGNRGFGEYDNYRLFEGELPFELPPIKD